MATSAESLNVPHIGPAPHVGRNLSIIIGLIAIAALATVYMLFGRRADARDVAKLEAFAGAFAEKCDAEAIGPTTEFMRHAYTRSEALQATVEQQYAALQGGADCNDVYKALRAADFPLPAR